MSSDTYKTQHDGGVVIVVTVYARGWIIARSEDGHGEYALAVRYRDWAEFLEYRRESGQWPDEWGIRIRAEGGHMAGLDWTHLPEPYTYAYRPLWWHLKGLSQTASGYGRKLTSARGVILPDGRTRRVYVTCFSNASTAWILLDGVRRLVR